jgi:hypothetical protein
MAPGSWVRPEGGHDRLHAGQDDADEPDGRVRVLADLLQRVKPLHGQHHDQADQGQGDRQGHEALVKPEPGTNVMILKVLATKNWLKICVAAWNGYRRANARGFECSQGESF